VGAARQGVQDERASNPSEHFGDYGDDMREFIGALGSVTSSCLQALETCFERELETLDHYRDVCAELELGATRLADSRRCITFIDAGLRSETCDDDLSGTENQWLGSLTTQLANVTKEQSAIALEKAEQIKGQIAEIQLEADQASELIKKLGAETLEPPATVLQTLTSQDLGSEDTDAEVDYEDSIDQYIEWMKKQREAIRDQRRRIEELDQKMADAERAADRQYSGRLEPIQRRKEELTRNLEDALLSASKDAEETETRLNALTQDASTLIHEYEVAVDKRAAFAANVEDAMASAMIRLGKVLDEANMASSSEGNAST
jgi:chromosome segregation ATPase